MKGMEHDLQYPILNRERDQTTLQIQQMKNQIFGIIQHSQYNTILIQDFNKKEGIRISPIYQLFLSHNNHHTRLPVPIITEHYQY